MNTINTQCPDVMMAGNCTKGEDCIYCKGGVALNFNVNAKNFVPKSKRTNQEEPKNEDKLKFNLSANEYVPRNLQQNYEVNEYQQQEVEEEEEDNEEIEGEEFDIMMKDIIDNEVMEELEEEESDDEKWFPKYKDCDCCKGFVYKCNGVACVNMAACFCKMKDECDEEDVQ